MDGMGHFTQGISPFHKRIPLCNEGSDEDEDEDENEEEEEDDDDDGDDDDDDCKNGKDGKDEIIKNKINHH